MRRHQSYRGLLPASVPQLSGWSWWLFLSVWIGLTLLSIVGCGLYLRDDVSRRPQAEYSLGLVMKAPFVTGIPRDGAVIDLVLSNEARRSGLKPGDRLLTFNGRSLPLTETPVADVMRALGSPATVLVTSASVSGRGSVHRLTNRAAHAEEGIAESGWSYGAWRWTEAVALLIFGSVIPLALAALLLVRRARDGLAIWASLAFVLVSIDDGMPGRTIAQLGIDHAYQWLNFIDVWLLFAVLTVFPDGRFRPSWCWPVLLLGGGVAALASFGTLSLNEANLLQALALIAPITVVWAKYRGMPPGHGRQQIRWALFGLALSILAYLVCVLTLTVRNTTVAPALFVWSSLVSNVAYFLFDTLILVAMTAGLMRYRLYDADATISRSVAYGALTISLIAVFAGTEKAIELSGEHYLGDSLGTLAGAIGAAVAAVMIGPLHHHVTRWAERRFRTGLTHLRQKIPLLAGDLRETATPPVLADAVLARIESGLHARNGAILSDRQILALRGAPSACAAEWLEDHAGDLDDGARLVSDGNDPLFPLRVSLQVEGSGRVGWLLLGPRPDGSLYGRDERRTLQAIADPVARALSIALVRERHQQQQIELDEARDRRETAMGRKLAELEAVVSQLQTHLTGRSHLAP